jgi:glycosyltransferase involved in cell wall biosynthesis
MRILFLSRWFPYPANNGSKIRIYNLLRGLSQQHEVTLLSFSDQPDVDPNVPEMRPLCREIQVVPWKPFETHAWRARLGFFSLTPRSVVDTFSPKMEQQLTQTLAAQPYDLVIASQWTVAGYSHCFRGVAALLEEIEVGLPYEQFAHASSIWSRFRHGLTWAKQRHYLARLLRDYRACTVVSDRERQLLLNTIPTEKTVEVIPNCINLADYSDVHETPQPNHLIFTGSFRYSANHDAMVWFLQEIYPRLQGQVPEVHLTITGDHSDLPLPPAANVTLTGFVDNVHPLIASAGVSVVPLRVGGGTRLKILEAMALRTPVVTTSKGAEGLDAQPGEHLLIADTPEAFAEAVVRVLKEPGLRQRLANRAQQLVSEKYDWATMMPRFLNLVERVACTGKPSVSTR